MYTIYCAVNDWKQSIYLKDRSANWLTDWLWLTGQKEFQSGRVAYWQWLTPNKRQLNKRLSSEQFPAICLEGAIPSRDLLP
jgi:hypothetical protein